MRKISILLSVIAMLAISCDRVRPLIYDAVLEVNHINHIRK